MVTLGDDYSQKSRQTVQFKVTGVYVQKSSSYIPLGTYNGHQRAKVPTNIVAWEDLPLNLNIECLVPTARSED